MSAPGGARSRHGAGPFGPLPAWLALIVAVAALPSSPARWWRYVRDGKPTTLHVARGGTVRLFVVDRGPNDVLVCTHLREAGELTLGEVRERLAQPAAPTFDDLTPDSADALRKSLENAGATVRTDERR